MKLKLSQMKKISADDTHTTMQTKEGHILKIAHNSLSKDHKKALGALPMMSDGGNPKLEESKKLPPRSRMADGGQVSDDEIIERKAKVDEYNKTHEDEPQAYDQDTEVRMQRTDVTPRAKYAEGDVVAPPAQEAVPQAPAEAALAQAAPQAPMAVDPAVQTQAPQAAAPSMVPASDQVASQTPTIGGPVDLTKSYNTQVEATGELAKGEQRQAAAKAEALKTGIAAQQKLSDDFQAANKHTQDELTGLRKAIGDGHIDPNHYLGSQNTLGRISTAVGVFLGGFGKGGNQVLDYVNKQIDNDIRAQQANVDNKQSLYSAALKQSENQHQAMNMTRLAMNDMTLNKLELAAQQTSNPIIAARAKQGIAAIQAQMAPMVQQQNLFKVLGSGSDSIKNINPEEIVPKLVPKEHQEAVFKEVERAKNTAMAREAILGNFDKIAAQMKSAGGLGRIGSKLYPVPEKDALSEQLTTTTSDKVGTVREAAMHAVNSAYVPQASDTDERVATRRRELDNYLKLQSAAPRFESYTHIPLTKFISTAQDPALKLNSQQKAFADYAKANPNAPGSQAVLKKLGLQ